jgi:hypothetical protein
MNPANDGVQLSLFDDLSDDSDRKKVEELDVEIHKHVSSRNALSAKTAAQKQEALLKKILQKKKGNRAKSG